MMEKASLIVAELSANHGGSQQVIKETIVAAKEAGADALKLQTFDLDHMTLNARNDDYYVSEGLWKGYFHYDLYKEIQLPWDWHEMIFEECKKVGLLCFSTPFDIHAVDFLESLGNPIYKIASSEISHIPLIKYAASKGKPMVFSTGVANQDDIELALKTIRDEGNQDITVLKCTAAYPTPLQDSNVLAMNSIKEKYQVKVGLSDHTEGHAAAVAAVAQGAQFIEKHFILDKSIKSADAAFSMTPDSFAQMVKEIRSVETALGKPELALTDKMSNSRKHMRSIFVVKDLKKGELFTQDNLRVMRPAYGIDPKYYHEVIGKRAKTDLKAGSPLKATDI